MAGGKSRKTSLRSDAYAQNILKRGDKRISQKETKEVRDPLNSCLLSDLVLSAIQRSFSQI